MLSPKMLKSQIHIFARGGGSGEAGEGRSLIPSGGNFIFDDFETLDINFVQKC